MAEPKWKKFEKSVALFVKALDPTANVGHDAQLLDIHTKTPRQRDVWVDVKVCNHFPAKILISCKRYKRKLNQQDIDAFNGELISSGAQLGVIYSYSGFGKKAITKANKLGINCCRLYENQPVDLPESIVFMSSYYCSPSLALSVAAPLTSSREVKTWKDLFDMHFKDDRKSLCILDAIVESYKRGENESLERAKTEFFPLDWGSILECTDDDDRKKSVKIIIRGQWKIYQGLMEAHLLNGSYNFTSGEFLGSLSTPAIDTYSSDPGPGWTLLEEHPHESSLRPIRGMLIKTGGDVKNVLLQQLGPREITIEEIELNQKNV